MENYLSLMFLCLKVSKQIVFFNLVLDSEETAETEKSFCFLMALINDKALNLLLGVFSKSQLGEQL